MKRMTNKHSTFFWGLLAVWCALVASSPAHAILNIEITKGVDDGIPIAVVPFGWTGSGQPPQAIADIVEADLVRSGRFLGIPRADFVSTPTTDADVIYKEWRVIKAEALVIGSVAPATNGRFDVQFRLYDVFKQVQLAGLRYTVTAATLRTVAHQIADVVYEKMTGEPGALTVY